MLRMLFFYLPLCTVRTVCSILQWRYQLPSKVEEKKSQDSKPGQLETELELLVLYPAASPGLDLLRR